MDWYDALVIGGMGCLVVAGWLIHPSLGLTVLGALMIVLGRGLDRKAVR